MVSHTGSFLWRRRSRINSIGMWPVRTKTIVFTLFLFLSPTHTVFYVDLRQYIN